MKQNQFIKHILNEVASSNIYKLNEEVDELTARHNTNAKFKNFNLDYAGEGCGSQYYGWGVYVSTDPEVTKGYRDYFANHKKDIEGTCKRGSYEYEVEIPDDDGNRYLNWDEPPLPELNRLCNFGYDESEDDFETFGDQYNYLAKQYDSAKKVSLMLSDMGYTGIVIEGNRNHGGGKMNNYVIFKESDVQIINRIDYEESKERVPLGNGYIGRATENGWSLINPKGEIVISSPNIIDMGKWDFDESIVGITFSGENGNYIKLYDTRNHKFICDNTNVTINKPLQIFHNVNCMTFVGNIQGNDRNKTILYDLDADKVVAYCFDVYVICDDRNNPSKRFLSIIVWSDEGGNNTYIYDKKQTKLLNTCLRDYGGVQNCSFEKYGLLTISYYNSRQNTLYDADNDMIVPGCKNVGRISLIQFWSDRPPYLALADNITGSYIIYSCATKEIILPSGIASYVYSEQIYPHFAICDIIKNDGVNLFDLEKKRFVFEDNVAANIDVIRRYGMEQPLKIIFKDKTEKWIKIESIL